MLLIILYTHRRPFYAHRSLSALLDNIDHQDMRIHVADDASDVKDINMLMDVAMSDSRVRAGSSSQAGGRGYGASRNRAMAVVRKMKSPIDAILHLEDDWELTRPFDPSPHIEFLQSHDGANCIRLGYLGTTQPLVMMTVHHPSAGKMYYHLLPDSSEPHVFAGHPRLTTLRYEHNVGDWPNSMNPGQVEFAVARRREAREGVYWPAELPATGGLFDHIGTIQARTDQQEEEDVPQ